MPIPLALMLADRDRCFSDWGISIVFREVAIDYDPLTQQSVETCTDTELTAIVSQGESAPLKTTAGQALGTQLTIWIKPEELPSEATNSRVLFDDHEYQIVSFHRRELEPYCQLECRRC